MPRLFGNEININKGNPRSVLRMQRKQEELKQKIEDIKNIDVVAFFEKYVSKKVLKTPQQHNYHLVDPSPWPLLSSLGAFGITSSAVAYFHYYEGSERSFILSLIVLISSAFFWWRDVIREGTFLGHHTKVVQRGLKLGMILFIISEVMFFFSFFWSYFHSSIAPTIEIGSVWPPYGIHVLHTWKVPLLNTAILVLSGFTITWVHHSIILYDRDQSLLGFFITISLAFLFTIYQGCEYLEADYNISDGIYGSVFYMSTGFHGFHVIIGTIFIIVCAFRMFAFHFSGKHHVGFECAAWYWHFVDVVWLILFICVYWWGNNISNVKSTYMPSNIREDLSIFAMNTLPSLNQYNTLDFIPTL